MGRLHGRNGVLALTDKDGREFVVDLSDWEMEYEPSGPFPRIPKFRMKVLESSRGPEERSTQNRR